MKYKETLKRLIILPIALAAAWFAALLVVWGGSGLVLWLAGGAVAVAAMLLIFRHPKYGVIMVVCSIFFVELYPQIPIFSSINTILGLAVVASWFLYIFRTERRVDARYVLRILPGFLILMVGIILSLVFGVAKGTSPRWIFTYVQLFMLVFLIVDLIEDMDSLELLMRWYIWVALLSSAIFLPQYWRESSALDTSSRLAGLAGNANEFAWYDAVAVIFVQYFFMKEKTSLKRTGWLVMAATLLFCIVASGSRTGLLALVAGFLFASLSAGSKRKMVRMEWLFAGGLLLILAVVLAPGSIRERVLTTFPVLISRGDTVGIRFDAWKAAWNLWLKHPIYGVGVDGFILIYSRYLGLFTSPAQMIVHNSYLSLLSETGILGFGGFTLIIGAVAWSLMTAYRRLQAIYPEGRPMVAIWLAALLLTLVMSVSGTIQYYKLFWAIFGVALVLIRMANTASPSVGPTALTSDGESV